jgi:NTP pyrophosphatase (non-canonical NTP hydrolase)
MVMISLENCIAMSVIVGTFAIIVGTLLGQWLEQGKFNAPTPSVGGTLLKAISHSNNTRHHGNLTRRVLKLGEEYGEACQALLHVTSATNAKKMSWTDVREELADCVIVAVDCAITPMPDQANLSLLEVEDQFMIMIEKKLAKWRNNRDTGKVATDAE